eukprot:13057621-Alexandrium_andersonii.AAC.1
MSASLVGSEMCIRDRIFAVSELVAVGSGMGLCRAVPVAPLPFGATVSYTHLTLPTICSV